MKGAFTIATANYLSQAKTVADSFLAHHPDCKFSIFLLDKIHDRFDVSYFSPAEVIEIETQTIEHFEKMLFSYTIFELSNALKPFIAELLLETNSDIDTVIYFDCDIRVYAPLSVLDNVLSTNNILITPHFRTPLPLDGLALDEQSFLNSGIYNGGFFVLRKSEDAFAFIKWWKERLKEFCVVDFASGLFVDQIWLNFVPLYFNNTCVIEDQGYNVAYWNMHERSITTEGNKYYVNDDTPLAFFHFSGYDFSKPALISKYQTRYDFKTRQDVSLLFEQYQREVLSNRFEFFNKLECHYVASKTKRKYDLPYLKYYFSSRNEYPYRIKRKLKKLLNIKQ